MNKMKKNLFSWLLVFIWSVLIFYGSSIISPQPTDNVFIDFILHKVFHLFEYAVLFILVHKASARFSFALLYIILYAFSDEIHQSFVSTRESTLRDVMIDFVGGLLGWWFTLQIQRRKRKK